MTDTTDTTVPESPDDTTTVDDTAEEITESGNFQPDPEVEPAEDPETFPRSYVEKLRREAAGHRERAAKGDTYAQRLHTELVRATGKLADPTDLPFSEDLLADPDKMVAAIDDLLARKPHLASRRPVGDIGQGPVSGGSPAVDLAAMLRQRAG